MIKIEELKFDAQGLIPAIVVDVESKKVLTLAYMNRESLEISLREGRTCFWSRSRQELWRKGETSGNVQHIVSITADCDRDALVVVVHKEGPACHLGTDSCFTAPLYENGEQPEFSLKGLYALLEGRRRSARKVLIRLICLKKVWIRYLKKLEKNVQKLSLLPRLRIGRRRFMKLPIWPIIRWF